jgi:hypothetical protein
MVGGMDFSWPLVIAGALVGAAVGLTGMGGGALMTPLLVMIFGVDPMAAVGSDLLASVAMKPVGAAVHHRAGTVRWDLVRWLLPTAVPAGFAGAFVMHLFGQGALLTDRLKIVIGAALLLSAVGLGVRALLDRRRAGLAGEPGGWSVKRVPTLAIGLVGGLVVGMTSVGAGSLIMVMLMLTHPRLQPRELVGTDLVQAVPLVAAAAVGHLVAGDTSLPLAGVLLIGAIPGIYLGARLATKAPNLLLRWVLAVLLVGSGLALWNVSNTVMVTVCLLLAVFGAATRLRSCALRRRAAGATRELADRQPASGAAPEAEAPLPEPVPVGEIR